VSAYDFGPWPLLEGVTELPPAVTQVRQLKQVAAAAAAAPSHCAVYAFGTVLPHGGCAYCMAQPSLAQGNVLLPPLVKQTAANVVAAPCLSCVTCRRCNRLQQYLPMDSFLMSCRWTLSSQQYRQPVKQGQPYASTRVGSGSAISIDLL
jgi:hypothetical protein